MHTVCSRCCPIQFEIFFLDAFVDKPYKCFVCVWVCVISNNVRLHIVCMYCIQYVRNHDWNKFFSYQLDFVSDICASACHCPNYFPKITCCWFNPQCLRFHTILNSMSVRLTNVTIERNIYYEYTRTYTIYAYLILALKLHVIVFYTHTIIRTSILLAMHSAGKFSVHVYENREWEKVIR